MPALYLLRFDDICASMDWGVWNRIEAILEQAKVNPVLAVVPDNRDAKLAVDPPNPDFWRRVRDWQARGWTIGMHGYRHEYVSRDPGILGLNPFSEFAGLPRGEQLAKLESSMGIFKAEGIKPSVWVAPAHSFDADTVKALKRIGIKAVSDGYALWPYKDAEGMFWLPQQLWRFRRMPVGVWTVCFHINGWSQIKINSFEKALTAFRGRIADFESMHVEYGQRSCAAADRLFGRCFRAALWWRRKLHRANAAATHS